MKVSKYAIEQFRQICRDEKNTSDKEVEFKIRRDFDLGTYVRSVGEECVVRGLGTLRLRCEHGVIVDVFRSKKRLYVSSEEKQMYNEAHGMGLI